MLFHCEWRIRSLIRQLSVAEFNFNSNFVEFSKFAKIDQKYIPAKNTIHFMFTSSVEHFNLSRSLIGLHTLLQLWDLTFTRYWLISLMYSKIFVPVVMTSTVISLYHLPPNFLLLYDFLNSENSKRVWIMYVYRTIFASFLFTFIIILFVYCLRLIKT